MRQDGRSFSLGLKGPVDGEVEQPLGVLADGAACWAGIGIWQRGNPVAMGGSLAIAAIWVVAAAWQARIEARKEARKQRTSQLGAQAEETSAQIEETRAQVEELQKQLPGESGD